MQTDFYIRILTEHDIDIMANARKEQENENGNGATNEYIYKYKNVLEHLFKENKIIAVGAFKDNKLVSIACYNLINFGEEKKIPYLCAVWTDPQYRGMELAIKVHEKLNKNILKIKECLQPKALLTLEGTKATYNLYKKLGYENVTGEMTFLGEVQKVDNLKFEDYKKDSINKSMKYYIENKPIVEIIYSEEQFFAHPLNIDGKMSRIISIKYLQGDVSFKTLNLFLQHFLSEHRFCKFNVKELLKKENNLYKTFMATNNDIQSVIKGFENMNFYGINNTILKIKISNNVMQRDLSEEFCI